MSNILTSEDKKYIRRICRYLGSLGMREGNIEFEIDDGDFDCDINWEHITHFSNNYNAEIPDGFKEIIKKILDNICENDLINSPDVESINYERLEFVVDCESGEISVQLHYGYYAVGDSQGNEFTVEEDEDLEGLFETIKQSMQESKVKKKMLTLSYNGSGDSGYIESEFDEGMSVPSDVEDWCYRALENLHGGWEINEGSQGRFIFIIPDKTIELEHTYNVEENESDTLWEEKF